MFRDYDRHVYKKQLKDELSNWLSTEGQQIYEQAEAKYQNKFRKILEEFTETTPDAKDTGISSNKWRSFNNNPIFKAFIQHKKEQKQLKTLKLQEPYYNIIEPDVDIEDITEDFDNVIDKLSKLDGLSLSERKRMRNNLLINMYWGSLTSKEGSRQMLTPATYIDVKISAKKNIIRTNPVLLKAFREQYKNKIEEYGSTLDALDHLHEFQNKPTNKDSLYKCLVDFIENYKEADDACDVVFYTKAHRNLMDGNDLIGIFALNQSRHQKLQLCRNKDGSQMITLKNDWVLKVKNKNGEVVKLDEVDRYASKLTGVPIYLYGSQYQAASPDNGKDPQLGDMGINTDNADIVSLATAMGLPMDYVSLFNGLVSITRDGKYDGESEAQRHFKLSNYVFDFTKLSNLQDKVIAGEMLTEDDDRELLRFKLYSKEVAKLGEALKELNTVLRADTTNGALSPFVHEVMQRKMQVQQLAEKVKSPDFPISGFEECFKLLLDSESAEIQSQNGFDEDKFRRAILNTKLPRLQAAFTCGITSFTTLVSKYLPELSTPIVKAVQEFGFITGKDLSKKYNEKYLKQFLNELTLYIISKDTAFSENNSIDTRNYYIHDFPMKYKQFLYQKDEEGNYVHKGIKDLPLFKMLSNVTKKGIKFDSVGTRVAKDSAQWFTQSFNALFTNEDPKVQEFGEDLLRYMFYNNALHYGHSSFSQFLSVEILEQIPGLQEVLNDMYSKIATNQFDLNDFINAFMTNHPDLVPTLSSDVTKSALNKNTKTITLDLENDNLAWKLRGTDAEGNLTIRPFVKYFELVRSGNDYKAVPHLYKLDDKSGLNRVIYKEVQYNPFTGEGDNLPYYNRKVTFDSIDFSKLKERGSITTLKEDEEKSEGEEEAVKGADAIDAIDKRDVDDADVNDVEAVDKNADPEGVSEQANEMDEIDALASGEPQEVMDYNDEFEYFDGGIPPEQLNSADALNEWEKKSLKDIEDAKNPVCN